MTGRCHVCGTLSSDPAEGNFYDTGGAALVRVCGNCRKCLERRDGIFKDDVCVVCAEHATPGRSRGMEFFDAMEAGEGRVLHVCDECRSAILFDNTEPAEVVPA